MNPDKPQEKGAPTPEEEIVESETVEQRDSSDPSSAEIAQIKAQRDEYLALAQRVQADFDNFRRRNAQVRVDAHDSAVSDTIKALLPVVDNMERAVYHAEQAGATRPLLDGTIMVHKSLMEVLEGMGLQAIPALGETFDPALHNAVVRTPAQNGELDGQIVEVFQTGYRVGDRIIRYSMVRVAHIE